MSSTVPTTREPADAGRLLTKTLKDPASPHTVADVATMSGLPLRDVEQGLTWLTKEYRGHLRVTEGGELLYLFPYGFTQPWKTRDALTKAGTKALEGVTAAGRFIVRAWLMIVLLAYVAIFLAILIGMTFARQGDDRRGNQGGGLGGIGFVLFRVLGDALFWTFHPFSPFAVGVYDRGYADRREPWARPQARREDEVPFYEKVNRFFFGPTLPKPDPRAAERAILTELRADKGRIGLADVMRVTGLTRGEADPLMAKLMLDYGGDVAVSEDGGLVYRFEAMRLTTDVTGPLPRPKAAWEALPTLPPLTGNSTESNLLIAALNSFNIIMSLVALDANLTLAKLPYLFLKHIPLARLPYDGTPIVLGLVPLCFSLAIFLLPIGRAALRPLKQARVARERGRLGVLREVLTNVEKRSEVTDAGLERAYARAAGVAPKPGEISSRVAELGADVAVEGEQGRVRYRFADLETEAEALEAERDAASEEEKKVGRVVFASDD
jgi:hypothetical protein